MKDPKLTGQTFWEDYWEEKPGKQNKKTSLLIREIPVFKALSEMLDLPVLLD